MKYSYLKMNEIKTERFWTFYEIILNNYFSIIEVHFNFSKKK